MSNNGSGISPWTLGQLSPGWTFQLPQGIDGWLPLTGVTVNQFSLIIYSVTTVNSLPVYTQLRTGVGVFSNIVIGPPASVQYTPVLADIPTQAGNYAVRVEVNFGGASPYFTFYIPWTVQP